jgi:putative ABC transport system permease protein
VPISTAKLRLMGSASSVNRDAVAYILAKAVRRRHDRRGGAEHRGAAAPAPSPDADSDNDFTIANPAEAMALQHASTRTFAWLLASVASVSLLVGGISIMNIMLVSVSNAPARSACGLPSARGAATSATSS